MKISVSQLFTELQPTNANHLIPNQLMLSNFC
jgi:hypothetical protein